MEKNEIKKTAEEPEPIQYTTTWQSIINWLDGYGKAVKYMVAAAGAVLAVVVVGCKALDDSGFFRHSSGDYYGDDTASYSQVADSTLTDDADDDETLADVTIERLPAELDVQEDGLRGMRLHYKVEVDNHKNDSLDFAIFFFKGSDEAGGKLYCGSYRGYRATDDQVCVGKFLRAHYDESVWEDLSFFIPYDALGQTLSDGKYDLSAQLYVRDIDNDCAELAESDIYNFEFTWLPSLNSQLDGNNSGQPASFNFNQPSPAVFIGNDDSPSQSSISDDDRSCPICCGSGDCISPNTSHYEQYCCGDGVCSMCYGSGWRLDNSGNDIPCTYCGGTGRCGKCHGTGKCHRCGGTGKW